MSKQTKVAFVTGIVIISKQEYILGIRRRFSLSEFPKELKEFS
jgi:hypothetical protein